MPNLAIVYKTFENIVAKNIETTKKALNNVYGYKLREALSGLCEAS